MNIPNILTMARIVLILPFVMAMQYVENPTCILLALVIFAIASFTDLLDGKIARKYNLITNFGKLMDPLADKLLVMSAMLGFVEKGWAPAFVVIIILSREFLVTSVRLIAASEGVVIPADKWGKAKTVVQMVWIIFTLLWMYVENAGILDGIVGDGFAAGAYYIILGLMCLAVILTIISGVNYIVKNKNLILK